jgi:hypothetical protein
VNHGQRARVADRSSGVGRHSEGVIVCVSCRIRQRFCGWRNKISVSVSVSVSVNRGGGREVMVNVSRSVLADRFDGVFWLDR